MWRATKLMAAATAVAAVVACGGSDDPAPPTMQPASSSTVVGTITGFGSVIVNGVKFDDSTAAVTIDGATASRDRLRVGMVVQIRGRIHADGTGVGESIRYEDCAEGPITAMNRVRNTLTVMGQTVQVDEDTEFDGVALRDMNSFAIGDLVEVGCLPDPARNTWRATRLERKGTFANGVSEVGVKGTVSNLNLAAGTCTVGGLTVNFGGIPPADRPLGLANGMNVEVAGRNFANGILTADRLRDRDRDRLHTPSGDGIEVEGYVSDFVSLSSFKVNGQAVNAANATIRNGTAADIANGLKVEVEGTMTDGVIVAKVVIIKLLNNVRVEAGMQAKGTDTITLLGRPIKVNADTGLRDRAGSRGNQPKAIGIADLAVGDRLEVKAYRDAAGALVATQVERTDPDALVVVKGPADAKTPITSLTLAGFSVATGPNSRYRDASGDLIDAVTFYNTVQVPPAVPTLVHARGVVPNLAATVVDSTRTVSTIGELEIGGDH